MRNKKALHQVAPILIAGNVKPNLEDEIIPIHQTAFGVMRGDIVFPEAFVSDLDNLSSDEFLSKYPINSNPLE